MKSVNFLDIRKKETLQIISAVKTVFEPIENNVFNNKPSSEKWSIAECFQHLNLTLAIYIPQMVELVKQKELYPKLSEEFSYSFLGKMAVKFMAPKEDSRIPYKMKTFDNLNPGASTFDQAMTLRAFLDFQNDTLFVIEELNDMNLSKPKIITAAGRWLKMGIGDALHFMIAHNQRHLQQAQNNFKLIT